MLAPARIHDFVDGCRQVSKSIMKLALSIALLCAGLSNAAAQSWGLPQLMQQLSQVHAASARFTERKTIQLLDAPLISSGTLTYAAPAYISKTTETPTPQNFVLDHNNVTISAGPNQPAQKFSLNDDPRIAGLVQGIRATLAGDLPALSQVYSIQFTGTETDWQLLLHPKNPALAYMVKWMIIRGAGNRITTIDSASANGDHSEMGIVEVAK
jgi:outer membrane lipoprotein-sorting protein